MPYARVTDPETSHEAAASVQNIKSTKTVILWLLQSAMTDIELVNAYNAIVANGYAPKASESGIRTRRADLVKTGEVVDTGMRSKTPSGRNAIVWQEKGSANGKPHLDLWWL